MIVDFKSLLAILEQPGSPAVATPGPHGLRIEFPAVPGATPLAIEELDANEYVVRIERVEKDGEDWVVALEVIRR